MKVDIKEIFDGFSFVNELAEFFGLVESLEIKIDRLTGAELEAGLRALEQAGRSEKERVFLLREARVNFNKAISLETTNERLISAYIGLAFCHYNLDDQDNCREFLEKAKKLEYKIDPITETFTNDFSFGNMLLFGNKGGYIRNNPLRDFVVKTAKSITNIDQKKNLFYQLQSSIDEYLDDL